ncbi:TatD family hydrolase [Candidatus Sulfurimonas marisnigri]|uniref:TatD family hydrolase n=1 Tax=Candidatus Sulfurimonas marisnigri TaxID=2740405 RepID=A0A7S7M2L0_9BACT|nr:TatD family hydrolase [Candidatus Sulfurimonas marisnigri]QOY55868.1 TatD family hydrolase [Candidatus Sulfurimonas marisnigri]
MIIDTHVHLDDERYIDDLDKVLNRARESGVERFIIPGADPKNIDRAVEISESNDDVYFAVGVHPYDMDSFDTLEFEKYISHSKCVAIGECGLDYFRLKGTDEEKEAEKQRQKKVFIAQIELAKKHKKPLIVHIRDASRESKEILINYNAHEVGGVLHCYNADEELLSLADKDFYFGIGGVLTFKNAKKLVNVLPKIPSDKLLIETDGPYLTPMPHRGERNEPLYTIFVAKKISELLEISLESIERTTTENALKLFNIS